MTTQSAFTSLKRYYNIVYDQCFSPNRKHLITCDSFGQIATFNLASALSLASDTAGKIPTRTVQANDGPLYALERAEKLLVCGGEGCISVWKLDDLTKTSKDMKPTLVLSPPTAKFGVPETNSLIYDEQKHTLYSGCGDNNIHSWDLKTGQLKDTYSGHSDYIHCVCMKSGSCQFVSGSEDGTVKMWDPANSKSPVNTLTPGGKSSGGHWVGCVAVDNTGDWLVCGGSMSPVIYHLSTLSKIASLQLPNDVVTQAILFAKDRIITAGSEPSVRHWNINGDTIASVPSGLQHSFSLAYNTKSHQHQVLTVSGDSADVQVFTNFGYKAFSLSVNS